ncbi:amino acid deaminase/aldolase [Emticicia sp. CRIBPO]|uniref:alanine racemase n=1 Tax=Emticicia sp. CRIBPO TaxID=2683258 RepID=UPI001412BDEC|nr:alanine racemase [Emticicia sp. CRIBPO]NBA84918.1 amino acid deaminase/aldolase [Emticicia sp. CRIBPO]
MDVYAYYKQIFEKESKPLAFLDRDMLDQNIKDILLRSSSKKIRVASKSVRSIAVLKYLLQDKDHFIGLMSFTGDETIHLLEHGFDNIMLGYPVVDTRQLDDLCRYVAAGKKIYFMADLVDHVRLIQEAASKRHVTAEICLDIDMSSRFPFLYFGVYRSSVKNLESLKRIAEYIQSCPDVRLSAIMGYESQIAGLGDKVQGEVLKNSVIRFLKKISVGQVRQRRQECLEYLTQQGFTIEVVNGGGTGSLESTREEPWVTEVTVGSGFYSSHLFDSYRQFKHRPAVAFMLDITRNPQPGIFTCAGGGYVASGAVGVNKLPLPYLPEGVNLIPNEGAGEVQTPFVYSGQQKLSVGDPVIMRHSKAGEICERFNELYVVSEGKVIDRFKTYRGEGKSFM